MAKRNPNGYGTIKKLAGERKKPFAFYITTGYKLVKPVPEIDFLKEYISEDLYLQVKEQYTAATVKIMPMARQLQAPVSYHETMAEALIAQAKYFEKPFDLDKRKITFGQIYDILYDIKFSRMKKQTMRSYVSASKKCSAIWNVKMFELETYQMQKIMEENRHLSVPTLSNLMKLFHAIYKYCMANKITDMDYSQYVTLDSDAEPDVKIPFSREEVATLWNNRGWIMDPEKPKTNYGLSLIDSVLIQIYTGVRPSELLEIKKSDIHLEERWIDIRGTKTDNSPRTVPIHKKIIPLIETRLQCESEYLIPNSKAKHFNLETYRVQFFNPMCEHFGWEHTPHEARHTFVTFAAASNLNQVLKQKIVGHASGNITDDRYTTAFIQDLIKEIDKFEL